MRWSCDHFTFLLSVYACKGRLYLSSSRGNVSCIKKNILQMLGLYWSKHLQSFQNSGNLILGNIAQFWHRNNVPTQMLIWRYEIQGFSLLPTQRWNLHTTPCTSIPFLWITGGPCQPWCVSVWAPWKAALLCTCLCYRSHQKESWNCSSGPQGARSVDW